MSTEVSSQANSLDCFARGSAGGLCLTFIDEEDEENEVEVNTAYLVPIPRPDLSSPSSWPLSSSSSEVLKNQTQVQV